MLGVFLLQYFPFVKTIALYLVKHEYSLVLKLRNTSEVVLRPQWEYCVSQTTSSVFLILIHIYIYVYKYIYFYLYVCTYDHLSIQLILSKNEVTIKSFVKWSVNCCAAN